jgi:ribose transport system substrate-binding protein
MTAAKGANRMPIAGLGPHGERAAPRERLVLSEAEAAEARRRRFSVAVVLHTTGSDWARQQLAGMVATLGSYAAAVVEVVDCRFEVETQIAALGRLARERPDAVISLPIANTAVAEAHRNVAHAGCKLVLLDNAPTGLLPGTDYVSVVSADNFGLGEIAAELLSPHIPQGGTVGLLGYGVDFFVTNEREIAFRKRIAAARPDVGIRHAKFPSLGKVGATSQGLLVEHPEIDALFAVWDDPAMQAVAALRACARLLPMTTIDLGNEAALELAAGGAIKGIGAQQPYDQGVAVATATIMSLLGREPPPWVALPGLPVTRSNVVEAYQVVWHAPAPPKLIEARREMQEHEIRGHNT